eukprot:1649058-Ditylum_brightwellii.AAC.1
MKGLSVKHFHLIAYSKRLDALCGNIGNAYANAYATEKVYAKDGLEFGEENWGNKCFMACCVSALPICQHKQY